MLGVLDKYMFLDPKRALTELEKIKNNFESLQMCLVEAERAVNMIPTDSDKLTKYQNDVDRLNQRIQNVFLNSDVLFVPESYWQTPCSSHIVNKNRASLIQGQYGCLLSMRGFDTGIHKWTLNIIQRTSTCMIGVANTTVSRSGSINNYNTNGFYMNLSDGTLYSGPPFSYSNRACISGGVQSGTILILILNCSKHTLTYNYGGRDYLAYEKLPSNSKLYLAWDNNTVSGSEIEISNKYT